MRIIKCNIQHKPSSTSTDRTNPPFPTPPRISYTRRCRQPAKSTSNQIQTRPTNLFQVGRRQRLNYTRSLAEPRPENPVRVLEHAVLQTDDDELGALEPRLYQPANILRM